MMKRISLRSTILIGCCGILFFSLALVAVITTAMLQTSIRKNEVQNNEAYLQNAMTLTDNYLKDLARTSRFVFADNFIQDILRGYRAANEQQKLEYLSYLDEYMLNITYLREDIEAVSLFDKDLNYINSYGKSAGISSTNLRSEQVRELVLNKLDTVRAGRIAFGSYLSPDRLRSVTSPSVWTNFDYYYFYGVREAYQFYPYEKIGYIILASPVKRLQTALLENAAEDAVIFLLDNENQIVFEQTGELLGKTLEEAKPGLLPHLEAGENHFEFDSGDGMEFVSATKSEYSDWTLITMRERHVVFADSIRFVNSYILIFLVTIFIILTLIYLLVYRVTVPLQKLSRQMKSVRLSTLQPGAQVTGSNEIVVLTNAYNDMLETIDNLIESEYRTTIRLQQASLREQEYQLLYLRAQINPHFLYNTLDTIRILAALNKDTRVADMILTLAEFFRSSVSSETPFATILDEVRLVQKYFALMKVRFRNIHDVYDIDEKLAATKIPNFILQPLVENALQHGIKQNNYHGTIFISARQAANGTCIIEVADDGVGMSEESMSALNAQISAPENEHLSWDFRIENTKPHIGLVNIGRRLRAFFNDSETNFLQVSPRMGGGLCVQILIPALDHRQPDPNET